VYGDGSMMRDFTYIDDIIDGVTASVEKCQGYNIYNLGESRPISVNDLIAELEKALGKKAIKEYQPPQPGDVERTYADVTRAVAELGYDPKTAIEDGLAEFVTWLRRNQSK
jgi:UDP-glucuronate 4-epimerase